MIELLIYSAVDTLKLAPILFLTYLAIETINKKASSKYLAMISRSKKLGPVIGSFIGTIPQCGFAVSAANFYGKRIITLGTLISVFLVTSDEMLPILLANNASLNLILKIILIKIIVGLTFGIIIDYLLRNKQIISLTNNRTNCCNEKNILAATILHTLNILFFIFVISLTLNLIVKTIGLDYLSNILMQGSIFGPIIASIIGLIPSCASSVLITELYLSNTISFGSTMAGLLSGAGIGLAVLFRVNPNFYTNLKIVAILVTIGAVTGIIIDAFNIY